MNLTWIFVAVVYAIGVLIARRLRADFPWRIAVLFYVLVLIFLWHPMTGPYVDLPAEFLTNFSPWSGVVHHTHIVNYELNDLVMQIIPWAEQVRTAYRSGHLPLWNPLSGAGYPLLASAQSQALSPLRLLTLPLPLGYAFTAEAAMKMLIAMSFMYGFCRRRWSELPSAIGAVCFAFSTFIQVWLHFPLATAAVWIPAAILSIDLLIERANGRRIAGVAVAWSAMLLSGHPETVAHTAFIGALYILWVLLVERPLAARDAMRRIGALAIAMLLAALIASPFLAPFAEALRKSKRYQELQARPNVAGYYRDWPSMVLLFQPHFFGHVPEDKAWPQVRAESITAFAGVIGVGAWLGLLLRAARRRRWRDREIFFILIAPLILGIILAWPGVSTLFHLLFKFAANDRLRLMLCWTIATLTAAIIDDALREGPRYLLIGNLLTSTALLLLIKLVDFPLPAMRDLALLGVLPSLIVIAVSLLLIVPTRFRLLATCVLFAAIIGELWSATRTWNPVLPASMMYPTTPLIRFVQRGAPPEQFRITGIQGMLFPNTQAMYGLADIRAHDPMANGRYLGILRALAGYDTEKYFARWINTDTTLLNFLNVKYVLTEPNQTIEESDRYKLVYEGKDGRVYQNRDVLPRFFPVKYVDLAFRHELFIRDMLKHTAWHDTAIVNVLPVENDRMRQDFLHQPGPNAPVATLTMLHASTTDYTMRVRAPRHTLVVSSLPYWPGWRVVLNGKTTLTRPVNGAFLGYIVPPGESVVRVYYRPILFYVTLFVSLLAIAATIVIARRESLLQAR